MSHKLIREKLYNPLENRQKLRRKFTAEEMKMINKDKNLLSFTTKQKNEYRSELTKQSHHTDQKKKRLSDNFEFWENIEK